MFPGILCHTHVSRFLGHDLEALELKSPLLLAKQANTNRPASVLKADD